MKKMVCIYEILRELVFKYRNSGCSRYLTHLHQEVATAVHQVEVGWVGHPGCGAGHHKLPVEALLVRRRPVIVVKEDWLDFDWDLLGALCFVAAQMDSFVAATTAAHCKLDIAGR